VSTRKSWHNISFNGLYMIISACVLPASWSWWVIVQNEGKRWNDLELLLQSSHGTEKWPLEAWRDHSSRINPKKRN